MCGKLLLLWRRVCAKLLLLWRMKIVCEDCVQSFCYCGKAFE